MFIYWAIYIYISYDYPISYWYLSYSYIFIGKFRVLVSFLIRNISDFFILEKIQMTLSYFYFIFYLNVFYTKLFLKHVSEEEQMYFLPWLIIDKTSDLIPFTSVLQYTITFE